MPQIEVDAEQYELARRGHALLDKLYNAPGATGLAVKKLVEQTTGVKSPELALIETITQGRDEALGKINADLKALREEQAADKKATAQAKAEADLLTRVESVKKDFRFTDEGMEKVFDRMRAQNSADVEGAAAYVASQLPKAKPADTGSSYAPQSLNLYGSAEQDAQWADLNRDPLRWFDKQVMAIENEFKNAQ